MVKIHVTDEDIEEVHNRLMNVLEKVGANLTEDVKRELEEIKELVKKDAISKDEMLNRLFRALEKALGVKRK